MERKLRWPIKEIHGPTTVTLIYKKVGEKTDNKYNPTNHVLSQETIIYLSTFMISMHFDKKKKKSKTQLSYLNSSQIALYKVTDSLLWPACLL